MYNITIPKTINQIFSVFYVFGMWNIKERTSFCATVLQLFHLIYYISLVLSFAVGAFITEDKDELVVLSVASIISGVHIFRLAYIIWRKNVILSLVHQLCTHSTNDPDEFVKIHNKLNNFVKLPKALVFMCSCAIPLISIHPFLSSEKLLILNIAFPFDWKNSSIAFWLANAHILLGCIYAIVCYLLTVIVWYLMLNGAVKYEMLGNQLRIIGELRKTSGKVQKLSKPSTQQLFLKDLVEAIKNHEKIAVAVDELSSTFSNLFFIQVLTSSIGICGSVYALAFSSFENVSRDALFCIILLYILFDTLVIMYLGNEIKLSSDRTSYCLFESNWIGETHTCNKYIIILTEVLKRPKELIIGKLYPLNLNTFTSIVNTAYRLFNILQNLRS